MTAAPKRSWADRLRTAFKANDQKAFDEELEEAQKAGSEGGGGENSHHPVIVHINQSGVGTKPEEKTEEEMTTDSVNKTLDALAKTVTDGLKGVTDSIKSIDDRLKKVEARDAEESEEEKEARLKKEREEKETKDRQTAGTKDSASLQGAWQDVISRAEILAPGGTRGTFDAKAPLKTTDEAICGIRRDALRRAAADPMRKPFVDRALGTGAYEIDKMTCDALAPAFVAASEFARDAANSGVFKKDFKPVIGHQPMTPARLQEINMKFRGVEAKK